MQATSPLGHLFQHIFTLLLCAYHFWGFCFVFNNEVITFRGLGIIARLIHQHLITFRVTRRKFPTGFKSGRWKLWPELPQTQNREVSKGNAEHSASDPPEREPISPSLILWQYILSLYTLIWELSGNPPLKDPIDNRLTAQTGVKQPQ